MKYLIALLFSMNAYASGKISLEPRYDSVDGKMSGIIGFSVWERLSPKVSYDGWAGYGTDGTPYGYQDSSLFHNWVVVKNQLNVDLSETIQASPGVRMQYNPTASDMEIPRYLEEYYVRFTYVLWK